MPLHILCIDDQAIPGCIEIDSSIDIGRDPHCDIRLTDESCSRFHARIEVEIIHTATDKKNCVIIHDNNSSNGTWFHDQRIEQQELQHNDQFRCGTTRFIILDSAASDHETRIMSDSGNAIAVSHSIKTAAWKIGDNPKQLALIHHICRELARADMQQRAHILAQHIEKILDCSHVAIYMHGTIRAGNLGLRLAQRLAVSDGAKLYVLGKDLHGQTIAQEAIGSAICVQLQSLTSTTRSRNSRIIAVRNIGSDAFDDRDLQLLSQLAHDASDYFHNNTHGAHDTQHTGIDLIGDSQQMQDLRTRITRIAASDTTVLISGESGTGKEIIAQSIHKLSGRYLGPMICVNCAAITGSLFEAELFGHEQGAFTGATHAREGKIRAANGGTLFLDEIGEMSLEAQAKLLRVLQDQRVQAVGSEQDTHVDVRIIAASNRNLQKMVQDKMFRADLLYRLDVLRIHSCALHEHAHDIAAIAQFLIARIANESGRPAPQITAEVLHTLGKQSWPGNVRQLENTLRRALVFATDTIKLEHLELSDGKHSSGESGESAFLSLAELEAQHIAAALQRCAGNKTQAAKLLGISRPTIHKKIGDYGLDSDNKR